jgi:hypothetical protein
MIVDGHAISIFKNEGNPKPEFQRLPLRQALDAIRFDKLTNTGADPNILAAQLLLRPAVKESIDYMHSLKLQRDRQLIPLLRKEERRLKKWKDRREDILRKRIIEYGENSIKSGTLKKLIAEMQDYTDDRQKNWRDTHFQAATQPSTRLILVIEGSS